MPGRGVGCGSNLKFFEKVSVEMKVVFRNLKNMRKEAL